jgi:hypothetical protein
MSSRDIATAVRSSVLAWGALFAITFGIERPLMRWASTILGASWVPTVQLALQCCGLAAIGWLIGRWGNRGALIFAAMLAVWNFGLVPIDIPWLIHLLIDSFDNSRYLESFFTSLVTHVFLFGSLFTGAALSRPREQVVLRIQ